MGSWRPVIALAAIGAALWIAVALGVGATASGGDGAERLNPDVRPDDVVGLELTAGGDTIELARTPAGFLEDGVRPARPEVLDALLAALEYTYARRRGDAVTSARRTLVVRLASGGAIELRLGDVVGDGALVWVGTPAGGRLITSTEAAQLFPAPASLRDDRIFRDAAVGVISLSAGIGTRQWRISGAPLVLDDGAGRWRVDRSALDELLSVLESVVLIPGASSEKVSGLSIRLQNRRGEAHLSVTGSCDERAVAVSSHIGEGCVERRLIERLVSLVSADHPFAARGVIDPNRRPLRARVSIGGEDIVVDPAGDGGAAARAWLVSLSRATGEVIAAASLDAPRATATIDYDRGEAEAIELGQNADGAWARVAGEPIAWRLESENVLSISPTSFRSRRLVDRDRLEIRQLSIRRGSSERQVYRRGDDGAWSPPLPAERIDDPLAHLSAERFVAPTPAPRHGLDTPRAIIDVEFDPPPIATDDVDRYTLRLGASAGGGCYAQLESDPAVFVVARALCALR